MGWLRLVGSLKLLVSFAGYSPFYRALLQKRPMILRSLLIDILVYIGYTCMYIEYTTNTNQQLNQQLHTS